MQRLIHRATARGLEVVWRDLGRRNGALTSGGFVVLNPRATYAAQRCTLAHEIGHCWHGHDWRGRHDRERDERQADTYAARLLISPVDYALAERVVGEHTGAMAKELGVTRRLVALSRENWAAARLTLWQSLLGIP